MFEATRQGGVFLTMVYAGLLCGVCYDILRALRRITGAGRIVTGMLDLVFWLGAAALCAYTLLHISREPLRLYALLGCAGGMLLYLFGVSELLYVFMRIPYRALCKLGRAIAKKRHDHTENEKKQQNSAE